MISFQNVSCGYSGREILADINLRLTAGSFHFLTGPSGTGKTTLLKLAYAQMIPTQGQVTIFGENSAAMSRENVTLSRRRIGVIHQDCQFIDHLNISDNIAMPLTVSGQSVMSSDLDSLLDWVALGQIKHAYPPTLSGGERQRAALARAIIANPDVILADEPTGNLDWDMSLRLMNLLVELNRMGKTILIATHDLQLIRHIKPHVTARILRIRDRKIVLAGADL